MTKEKVSFENLFDEIIEDISENGKSLRDAILNKMSTRTFYEILESDENKQKRYARACELRADKIAEDTLNIADSIGDDIITLDDGREVENQRVIQRDRLRVDTRKWLLAKLHPKKYGEKNTTELTGANGKDLSPTVIVFKDFQNERT